MSTPFEHHLAAALPRVYRAALGWMGEEQEAREVAQEALLHALRSRAQYDPTRPFYPWLYRIVRNVAWDTRARRCPAPGLDSDRVPDERASALDALDAQASAKALRRALDRVSEEHREILALRHFQDLSYSEMALILDIPLGTVMSRLFRARQALAHALEER